MRSAVQYVLFSGDLFFVACAVFVLAVSADTFGFLEKRARTRRVAALVTLTALLMAFLAAPPLPMVIALPTVVLAFGYVFSQVGRLRRVLAVVVMLASIAAAGWEAPYHRRSATLPVPQRIVVIGDSLSSGGFGERTPWPALLGSALRATVINLAAPSDDTAGALANQVPRLPPARSGDLVVVEIGGNDMLAGTDVNQVEVALDAILSAAREGGRRPVVLVELPLLPLAWRYGALQRRAASRYKVILVPRRVLARVLTAPGNTTDGLHLTQRGHDELANCLVTWAGWR